MIADFAEYRANYEFSSGGLASAQRLDVKLRAAGRRPASSGAPLAAHPIMPVQVARRRANSRRGSRLGRREKQRRTANFNDELGAQYISWQNYDNRSRRGNPSAVNDGAMTAAI